MTEIIVLVLLGVLILFAVIKSHYKMQKGGGCCGEHEKKMHRTAVRDKNKAHYPYEVKLTLGGMTCENCAKKIENALNSLEGVWATVTISGHQAKLLLKKEPDEALLRQTVSDAGYVVTKFELC